MGIISDLTAGATGGLFSGIGSLVTSIRSAITGKPTLTPEEQAALLTQAAAIEAQAAQAQIQLSQAQADINKLDAVSVDPFQRRWRPAVGWVCVAGLAYQFLICPILPWVFKCVAMLIGQIWHTTIIIPDLPRLDMTSLMPLLLGILGLGAMRTTEKITGKA